MRRLSHGSSERWVSRDAALAAGRRKWVAVSEARRRALALARGGKKDLTPLGSILAGLLESKQIGPKLRQGMAVTIWPEVVGDKLAQVSRATACRGGRLYVEVENSVWMQELAFLQRELLVRLNRRIGKRTVRRLVLKPKRAGGGW